MFLCFEKHDFEFDDRCRFKDFASASASTLIYSLHKVIVSKRVYTQSQQALSIY